MMAVTVVGQAGGGKKVVCKKCGAVLKYWPVDVKCVRGCDGVGSHKVIKCPKCGGSVYVRDFGSCLD